MPLTPHDFDPLAVVVDWLDACRSGDLNALLDLYDQQAILECACDDVCITGRASLSAYWGPRIRALLPTAFTLDNLMVENDGVWVDYRNHKGSLVWGRFIFSSSGKIQHTSCGPWERRLSS